MLALGQSGALPDVAPAQAQHAMVVSIHHLASDAGLKMLQAGGNAVDAAVATGFALAVVYPDAGNLGGGGFMMLRLANGEAHFLDFREEAPLAANANMYLDSNGKIIPEASTVGFLSVGVPGTVAGLVEAQRRFGKLPLRQVMAPAIEFAAKKKLTCFMIRCSRVFLSRAASFSAMAISITREKFSGSRSLRVPLPASSRIRAASIMAP
jgi:gamma-glutamyltranspeptidase